MLKDSKLPNYKQRKPCLWVLVSVWDCSGSLLATKGPLDPSRGRRNKTKWKLVKSLYYYTSVLILFFRSVDILWRLCRTQPFDVTWLAGCELLPGACIITVFWNIMAQCLADMYWRFRSTHFLCLLIWRKRKLIDPKCWYLSVKLHGILEQERCLQKLYIIP